MPVLTNAHILPSSVFWKLNSKLIDCDGGPANHGLTLIRNTHATQQEAAASHDGGHRGWSKGHIWPGEHTREIYYLRGE